MYNRSYQVLKRGQNDKYFTPIGEPVITTSPFLAVISIAGKNVTFSHYHSDDQYFKEGDTLYTTDVVATPTESHSEKDSIDSNEHSEFR